MFMTYQGIGSSCFKITNQVFIFLQNMFVRLPNLATFLKSAFIKQWREANFSFPCHSFWHCLLRRMFCGVSTTWLPCKKFKSSLWLTATTPERYEQNTYSFGCRCIIKCLQIVYKYCAFIIQQLQAWRRCGIFDVLDSTVITESVDIKFFPKIN